MCPYKYGYVQHTGVKYVDGKLYIRCMFAICESATNASNRTCNSKGRKGEREREIWDRWPEPLTTSFRYINHHNLVFPFSLQSRVSTLDSRFDPSITMVIVLWYQYTPFGSLEIFPAISFFPSSKNRTYSARFLASERSYKNLFSYFSIG